MKDTLSLSMLQFTKYGLVFMWHVVTANKFGKGVLIEDTSVFDFTNEIDKNN